MSEQLQNVIDQIKMLYLEIGEYVAAEQELIENLACTVEHFEKQESVN